MGTKRQELENARLGDGCLGKSQDDEPLFILCARDALAPQLVREWVRRAAKNPGIRTSKLREATDLADAMEDWQDKNTVRMPD